MRLAETQAAFFALTFGEGAAQLEDLRLRETSGATVGRRIEHYRRANFGKASYGLSVAFPKTAAACGGAGYLQLLKDYFAQPVRERQTRWRLLRGLPPFLRQTAARWGRADLADLAELELARAQVAEDVAEPIELRAVLALGPGGLAATRLRFVPAVRLLSLASDVFALWQALEDGQAPPTPRLSPSAVLVWQHRLSVFHSPLGRHEANALARALAGAPLAHVFEGFVGSDDPGTRAHAALVTWFSDGLIAAIEEPPSSS